MSPAVDTDLSALLAVAQPRVLDPVPALRLALTFRIAPGADVARALTRLREAYDPSWGVFGLGEPLARAAGREIAGLRSFPALSGPGADVPSTQQALFILLHGDDRGTLFDRSQALRAASAPDFTLVDALDTFRYDIGRDLTGYEDGTENPKDDEATTTALVAQGALRGGSFVAVQRWVHDLAGFAARSGAERDAAVGRRREDNEEIDDAPATAHVKRSEQESFEPAAFMLRRSMPFSSGLEQGLEFIAFGAALDNFERVLSRMLGREDGIVDALFGFSRAVTGGYYFCPPLAAGKLDLRCIGV